MNKKAPFRVIFDKCPVCGGSGDYLDREPASTAYDTETLFGSDSSAAIGYLMFYDFELKGYAFVPDAAGDLDIIRIFGALGNSVVAGKSVWAAIYSVGEDGVTGTLEGETYAQVVQAEKITNVAGVGWEVRETFQWIELRLQSAVTLDTSTTYLVILKTNADKGLKVGTITGGLDIYHSVVAGGDDDFPSSVEFTAVGLVGSFAPLCVEGIAETCNVGVYTETTEAGNGYELVDYKGEKMCPKCKKTRMMQDESEVEMDRVNREDEERAEMGFTKTYSE